ncbi:SDR family NAD(P)-dependent oxidoreductase [Actinospica durhamensis]|uniref:SDR family NAD(P)-dependent oxidoreductase n=1 Tax=Actinospica durhamensis TaxID=1508375 RepID=A0A941EPL1_9ACTN|nr:SDR family NAD(P)-dependent oxidoreductase [Actinospica durhamensis]MBR7834198.1 SDR family NAD(P)-dependent oxidoreductase [Actinospica durhamensis]
MKDSLGSVQSLLVLGGGSDIALATARKLAQDRTKRIILAGRPSERLDAGADLLRGLGAEVRVVNFDALEFGEHEKVLAPLFEEGDIDVVLLAFGVLGDQKTDERDPLAAAKVVQSNYVGAVTSSLVVAEALKKQGHGALVVLSSVAAERGRKDNFIYGSSKAGLDTFAQGLGDSLQGTGVHVMVVRPGFVDSKMTAGLPKAPMSTTPEAVAEGIVDGLRREADLVWVPAQLRYVFSGLRHLPRPAFRKVVDKQA